MALKQWGGAFGFSTEISPGAAPLLLDATTYYVGQDHLWPIDQVWDYHCGNPDGLFYNLRFFTPPLTARYGSANSAESFLALSQAAAYESHRAMFEAYAYFKYRNSTGMMLTIWQAEFRLPILPPKGVIQWMLNNGFPSMIWHLWDYNHVPGGSYFGVKKALCSGVLSCGDAAATNSRAQLVYLPYSRTVGAINHHGSVGTLSGTVNVNIRDVRGQSLVSTSAALPSMNPDSSVQLVNISTLTQQACIPPRNAEDLIHIRLQVRIPGTVENCSHSFLSLALQIQGDDDVTDYWVSCSPDVLDWDDSTYYITPCTAYANLTALRCVLFRRCGHQSIKELTLCYSRTE